jgi:hypothetical protein
MENGKVIDLEAVRPLRGAEEENQLIRKALENERLRETRREMEQLLGIEKKALELENGMPEYTLRWAESLRVLSKDEIKDHGEEAARLALIARALRAEEWHVLYRELALFSLKLLEQLESCRGMLGKIGLDGSPIKAER